MPRYEYKVVPAPKKGLKSKDIKGAEARFSHALEVQMNSLASEGWEYQRAETLPSTERAGLTGTTQAWRNMLVFRRPNAGDTSAFNPELLPAPQDDAPAQDGPTGDDKSDAESAEQNTAPASTPAASEQPKSKQPKSEPSTKD
ncbi:protein of unknown function [Sulfitobacter marinus]|uniref:DUF4177 domain-containing protein n=1 Tax=Sulfitobacter marinus TaxID=394264 RepID=A0A1I6S5C2_9RHOB|nr:DUF4177 domain-containing protein [Sulfitobacter marinus]SFS72094.1 protein of unknown function [Sulfitobacter marinus]